MSAERAAPRPPTTRQQHTADDIAFALDLLLERMERPPTLEEVETHTAALGRRDRAVLAGFFTRLGAAS